MDACGTDMLCGFLGQLFGGASLFEINLVRIGIYIAFCFSFYQLGVHSKHVRTESFINGIMYYINIQAFNSANIPDTIDENSEEHVKEAKSRLARKIMPRVPS